MTSFKSVEVFDYKKLKMIYDNIESEAVPMNVKASWTINDKEYVPRAIIHNYLSKAKKTQGDMAEVSVSYKYSKVKERFGRQFVYNAQGLQAFPRAIRHTITRDIYNDIDMRNAQPTILLQYCKKKNYSHKYLERSVEGNEKYLEMLMERYKIDRHMAKEMKIKMFYGGGDELIVPWYKNLKKELVEIHKKMIEDEENAELLEKIQASKKDKYNLGGKLCSHILCDIENNILMACIDYLKMKKISIKNIVLVFDGFMIKKDIFDPTEKALNKMSKYVKEKTGYSSKFVNKPQDEIINLDGMTMKLTKEIIIEDDVDACDHVIKKLKNRIIKCEGIVYVKTRDDRIWTNNEKKVEEEIIETIIKLNLVTMTKSGTKSYSRNVSGIVKILRIIRDVCPTDNTFIDKLCKGSLKKIFFEDGVYDFEQNKFREETNDDITPIRIHKKFPTNISDEMTKKVIDVLNSIFERDEKKYTELSPTAENMMRHYARAIGGFYGDKDWIVGIGERNSGKGILTEMCQHAFQDYVSVVDANNLINKTGIKDEALSKMWLMSCMWSRMVFANEINISDEKSVAILNGILIKSLASGGDKQNVRTLYQTQISFVFCGRLFLFFNTLPEIKPTDTAQTMTLFEFPNKFIKPKIYDQMEEEGTLDIFMKKGNDDLKDIISMPEFSDAFIDLVIKSYNNYPVVNIKEITESVKEYRIDAGDELLYFKEIFDFTDKRAELSANDIMKIVREKFPYMSPQRIKTYLTKNMGLMYVSKLRKLGVRGYYGVKLKLTEEVDI